MNNLPSQTTGPRTRLSPYSIDFLEALHQVLWEALSKPLIDILVNHIADDPAVPENSYA